ncbi:unnamed protein product [Brassica napus]|uniref:(rape) hypothetical protein n=1 Tax=Brassica napus TaxID=3708 RepID=A0A816YPE4_BRANA|nr:unnamed protein product [Brassica napus]
MDRKLMHRIEPIASEEVRVALGEKYGKEGIGNEIDLMISGDGAVSVVTNLSDLKLFGVVFALPSSSEPATSEKFSTEMERKAIPKARHEKTGEKGCFITNMHCMSCNPEFEQLLRYLHILNEMDAPYALRSHALWQFLHLKI